MAKKNVLELLGFKPDAPQKKPQSQSAMLLVSLLLLASLAGIYLILQSLYQPSTEAGTIQVFLDGGTLLFENSTATARAFSSCGAFSLLLDGQEIASGEGHAQTDIALRQGSHTLEAKNSQCSALLAFIVRAKECDGRETRACSTGSCPGTQTCYNGLYSGCVLPKKTCVPGRQIGCSSDSCKFGYKTCNVCGTGYGECLPPADQPKTPPCTGASCG